MPGARCAGIRYWKMRKKGAQPWELSSARLRCELEAFAFPKIYSIFCYAGYPYNGAIYL